MTTQQQFHESNGIDRTEEDSTSNNAFMGYITADAAINDGATEIQQVPRAENLIPGRPSTLSSRSKSTCATTAHLPPRNSTQHTRNVSFGAFPSNAPLLPSSTPETFSHSRTPTGSSLDRHAMSLRLKHVAAAPVATNPAGRITMEDLLGQGRYESEAVTNILAAFETQLQQQQPQQQLEQINTSLPSNNDRDLFNGSAIFSNVPTNLSMDLSTEREDEEIDDDDLGNFDVHASTSKNIFRSEISDDSHVRQPSNGTHPSKNQEDQALLLSSERGDSGHGMADENHRQDRLQKLDRKAYAHRRIMSVEDQLVGLQFALSSFQENTHPFNEFSTQTTEEESSRDSPDDLTPNATAGELLGHHAGLLLDTSRRIQSSATDGSQLTPVQEETDHLYNYGGEESCGTISSSNMKVGRDRLDSAMGATKVDIENAMDNNPGAQTTENLPNKLEKKKMKFRSHSRFSSAADKVKDDLEMWKKFFSPRKDCVHIYVKRVLLYMILPFTAIAAILFYFAGNPPTGRSENGEPGPKASTSWWLLFVARQIVTFSISLGLQSLIIDFLCVGTRLMVLIFGPILTLLIVQSKGWPFVTLMWGLVNFGLLYGENRFVRHWLYFQPVSLFNDSNPSGHIVDSDWNRRLLLIMVSVSLVVTVKRFLIGLYLGRQTFHHFGAKLAKVMSKMVLVAEVAQLAKRIEKGITYKDTERNLGFRLRSINEISIQLEEDNESMTTEKKRAENFVIDTTRRHPLTGSLVTSERMKLMQLLESWEEPEKESTSMTIVSIASVLKFRNALAFINNFYPFSHQFGLANTRENCIESAQDVYNRLTLQPDETRNDMLRFETLALIAVNPRTGQLSQEKARDLIRIFRPDRQGNLSVLDFIKSVDSVYKDLRFLQASIENSTQIDKSFENLVNVVFYAVVISFIMSQLGFDPFALFLSLSSVVLAFAFAIGSASAKYFEGLLFILVRRPYGIGDLIHVSNIESGTALEGSTGWTVNNVTLFETEMTWLPTMERCSVSNGSLANSRIINWARSPTARFVMFLIFPIDTPYETLEIFKLAVEEYLKARPREWLSLNAFRVNFLQGEKSWMRIEVVIQHRESWQNVGTILDSKGNFMSYCTEVQKMLGIQYKAPHLPIEMTVGDRKQIAEEFLGNDACRFEDNLCTNQVGCESGCGEELMKSDQSNDNSSGFRIQSTTSDHQSEMFRSLAQTKYNIRV